MKSNNILGLAAATLLLGFTSVASAALVWDLGYVYEYNGANPEGPPPWATITLEESGPGLQLTIESKLVPDSGNFFDKVGLSYSGTYNLLLAQVSTEGAFADPSAKFFSDPSKYPGFPGGEKMNLVVEFKNAGSSSSRFDGTDKVVYSLMFDTLQQVPDKLGLFTSILNGNDWLVVAHVNGLGDDNEFSAGITEIPIPEPTTIIAGSLLLLPFAATMVRRFRRN